MGQAYAALHRWMKDNKYKFSGPPRQIHLHRDEYIHPDQHATEVQFSIEKHYIKYCNHLVQNIAKGFKE